MNENKLENLFEQMNLVAWMRVNSKLIVFGIIQFKRFQKSFQIDQSM